MNCICARLVFSAVGRRRHGRDRRVAGLLGGVARFLGSEARIFGGGPKLFPLLSDQLELLTMALTHLPSFLGQHTEPLGLRARRLCADAALFDAVACLLDGLAFELRRFARAFCFRATLLTGVFGHDPSRPINDDRWPGA